MPARLHHRENMKTKKEAARAGGAAHFMCSYDGNYDTSPSGFIYWRNN